MLLEFLRWFAQQLSDLAGAPGRAARTPDAVVIRSETPGPGHRPALLLRRGGRLAALGPLDPGATPAALRKRLGRNPPRLVALEIPPGMLLERRIALPLAAEAQHRRVLAYEMDRYTPFAADALYWNSEIAERDRARGRLLVRLRMVPRAALAELVATLAPLGLAPSRLECQGAHGAAVIDLRSPGHAGGRGLRAAAFLCAGLAVAAIGLPFLRQWQTSARIEQRIAVLAPRIAEAATLRRRIADGAAGASAIAADEARTGDALRAIATITDLLPDDTHLTLLNLRARRLALEGKAASAAALIPLLAAAPSLRDPSFAAPVTREGGTESFSLRATVAADPSDPTATP